MAHDLDRIIRRALEEAAVRCEPGSADEAWCAIRSRLRSEGLIRRRLRIGWGAGVAAAVLLLVAVFGPMTARGWGPWQTVVRMFVGPGDTGLVQFGAGPRDLVAQKGSPTPGEPAGERTVGHAGEGVGALPPVAPSDEYKEVAPDRIIITDARHARSGTGAAVGGVGGTGVGATGAPVRAGAGGTEAGGAEASMRHMTQLPGGEAAAQEGVPEGKGEASITSAPEDAATYEKVKPGEESKSDDTAGGTNRPASPEKTREPAGIPFPSPEEMSLEAAAKKAPFEVLFPSWLPANTVVVRVTYQSLGPSGELEIHFGGPEGRDLWFSQRGPVKQYGSGTGFDRTKTRVRTVELFGSKAVLLDFSQDGSSLLEWFGGGVCYRMRSEWDGDVTLEVARSLKPVPR